MITQFTNYNSTSFDDKVLSILNTWRVFNLIELDFIGTYNNISKYKKNEIVNYAISASNELLILVESILYNCNNQILALYDKKIINLIEQFKQTILHDSYKNLEQTRFIILAINLITSLKSSSKTQKKNSSNNDKRSSDANSQNNENYENNYTSNNDNKNNNNQNNQNQEPSDNQWDDLSGIINFINKNKNQDNSLKDTNSDNLEDLQKNQNTDYNKKVLFDSYKYSVFTKKFDKTIKITELNKNYNDDLKIKQNFKDEIKYRTKIEKSQIKKLLKKLSSPAKTSYLFDMEEGELDRKKFMNILLKNNYENIFYQKYEAKKNDVAITILVDNSGSMRGRLIKISSLACYLIAKTLSNFNINSEILGFTTLNWRGGESLKMFESLQHKPSNPGRTNDLLHIIYKSFAEKNSANSLLNISLMQKDSILKENIDGEALEWAYKRLILQKQKKKILIVISDGTPVDDATITLNGKDYLINHLHGIINTIENDKSVNLIAIGIMHNVSKFYKNATKINSVEELSSVLFTNISRFL